MRLLLTLLLCQADVAGIPSQDLRAGGDPNKRYFLIGPGAEAPSEGFGLLIVLPGGSGSADFHPFVKRIYKHAVPSRFLAAQLASIEWKPGQRRTVVWPTAKSRVPGMKFTTEQFIEAVVKDVRAKYKVDDGKVFSLSWSSGGPAAYAASLSGGSLKGSFVAMSVFKPNALPPLARAKGHAYYLYHSPEDTICPIAMARDAEAKLKESGARTKLVEYDGGHGWRGPLYPDIRKGLTWLEGNP